MDGMATRLAIYRDVKALGSFADHDVQELMDGVVPFHPEQCNYQIASVVRGMSCTILICF